MKSIDEQLKNLGVQFRFVGRAEVAELQHILVPGERIMQCLNGFYDGGIALLCATDQRVLLVDKKPWFLTLEDIGYDMITEVDYRARLLDATTSIHTPSKTLEFKSWHQPGLRLLTNYVQQRIMQLRAMWQQGTTQQQQPIVPRYIQHNMSHATKRILIRPRVGRFGIKSL